MNLSAKEKRTFMKTQILRFLIQIALVFSLLTPSTNVHAAGVLYAKPTASGTGDCLSWANACTLKTALTNSISSDEIWAAAGVYKPTTAGTNRIATFQLKQSVAVYGGFNGTETAVDQRDPVTNVTILSGDIDNDDSQTPIITNLSIVTGNTTNSYHVVTGATNATLDGFTVTAGYANGSNPNDCGGGIFNGAIMTVMNITLLGNAVTGSGGNGYGGGIFNSGTLTVMNSTLSGNSAGLGGGIYNSGTLMVTGSTLSGNSAGHVGGGIYNFYNSALTVTNSTLSSNSANNGGGGIASNDGNLTVTNSTLSGNSAVYGIGGSIDSRNDSLTVTGSTLSGNSAFVGGGGIAINYGNVTVTNSTLSGNSTTNGGGIYNLSGTLTVTNSTLSENFAATGGGIYATWNTMVTSSTLSENSASGNGGGIAIQEEGTATVTDSTLSGNSAFGNGGGIFNGGTLTATNSTLSENSALYGGGGIYNSSTLMTTNSTLWGNSTSFGGGGGIYNSGTLTSTNSTLSGNSAEDGEGIYNLNLLNFANTIIANSTNNGDCYTNGTIGTNINNLVENGSCSVGGISFKTGDPLLAAPANNGGPTWTMALQLGSPAIDTGDDATCSAVPVNGLDQRGVNRPQGAHCDIGAFEYEYPQPALKVNYATGSPSSYFTISGEEFPAGGMGSLLINGYTLTSSLGIDTAGRFEVYLLANSTDTGQYTVTATVDSSSASVIFRVAESAPWRAQEGSGAPYAIPSGIASRVGAWVDSLTFVENVDNPFNAIKSGDIDLDTRTFILYQEEVQSDPEVETFISDDNYYELTFNPVGPEFGSGDLNPFSVPAIREAMNKLIDRNYLVNTVFDGLAEPRWLPINIGYPDAILYGSMVSSLETEYAYSYFTAKTVIDTEMLTLGAYKMSDDWYYNGNPVTLKFIIRNDSDGKRIPMGDYIADQLESIGFTVDRQYKSGAEASMIWFEDNPADGLWHIYTGGWYNTAIERDQGDHFEFYYSPNSSDYGFSPLWQAYNPTPTFADVIDDLAHNNFSNITQRDEAFQQALGLAMEDSVRLWLVEARNYLSRSVLTTSAYDIEEGISRIYPYTTRFTADEGGDMVIGSELLYRDVWNPVSGSTFTEDLIPINATMDDALLPDPTDAMPMPQRIESAAITAKTGLPIIQTEDWVTLDFDTSITVPPDAWAAWNGSTQEFISYGDFYTGTPAPEVLVKSVVTYPADLFDTVKWHDGSPLSMGDFVMAMILPFDRTDGLSAIYDPSALSHQDIVAFRIASVDPLIIETYLSAFQLDAELNVHTWWPNTIYGPQPWHTTALASRVEVGGWAAFSYDKAIDLGIPQISYISGPAIYYLDWQLDVTDPENIPYSNTLEDYISTAEAMDRWTKLQSWFHTYGHFWVGDGPFFLDVVDTVTPQITLTRFADFPDIAGKYDGFNEVAVAALHINFTEGAPGSYFTLIGENYPPDLPARLYVNGIEIDTLGSLVTDAIGSFEFILYTVEADPGGYVITVTVNPSASTGFILREGAPIQPQVGTGEIFGVPAGIAYHLCYLPLIIR
jgi:peptide/nickel transport system substrate-binding protein